MKVIDLLNKIANSEEVPYKIKTNDREYLYDKYSNWYFYGKTSEDMFIDKDRLNDEVEIIEEEKKIPEQINKSYNIRILDFYKNCAIKDYDMEQLIEMVQDIYDKQADIIDYLKSKGDE